MNDIASLDRSHAADIALKSATISLCVDMISVAEELGESLGMEDGPCPTDGLCSAWICQKAGCIKDKADRARALLSSAEPAAGDKSRDEP